MENAFLPPKPEEEKAELCVPNYLSDDALGHHPPPNAPFPQEWMQVLIADTIKDTLWEAEHKQLGQQADLGQRIMQRKGKATLGYILIASTIG